MQPVLLFPIFCVFVSHKSFFNCFSLNYMVTNLSNFHTVANDFHYLNISFLKKSI